MCHVSYRNVCQAGAAMILVHYGLKGNKKILYLVSSLV